MKIKFKGDITEIIEGAILLSRTVGFCIDEKGTEISVSKISSGHEIEISEGGIVIKYSSLSGFFRALTITLYQLQHKIDNYSLYEKECFDTCGVMIDVSRGTVPNVNSLEKFMLYMARMGLNMLMLYTEDVYEIKKYPYFGYMRGAYTEKEIINLVTFGEKLGIEVVPCIQTLGHLEKALRWKAHSKMCDTKSVLMIDEEETYTLIEEMLRTARKCFKTRRIHIGMDEAHDVGLGNYLTKNGFCDRYDILIRHLNRVVALCEKYDFEPMMWSDMFFRLGSQTKDYYDTDAVMPSNIKEVVPKGLKQVYWDYYHKADTTYKKLLAAHKTMGDVIFAGGVWTWTGFSPRYAQTMKSTHPALKMCHEEGIKDVFATIWFSDYSECELFASLLGLQLYAEYNVSDSVDDRYLEDMFKICTGLDAKSYMCLDADDFEEQILVETSGEKYSFSEVEHRIPVISKQILYQDILIGLFDKNFEYADLKRHYTEVYNNLCRLPNAGEFEYIFQIARAFVNVVKQKCDMGIRLKRAYDTRDKNELSEIVAEMIDLLQSVENLHGIYAENWYKNNKGFGFEEMDMRLGGVKERIKRAIIRVSAFVDGELDIIDELEPARLEYEDRKTPYVHLYYVENMRRA